MHQRAFIEIEWRFHRLEVEPAAHHGRRTYVSWSRIDEDRGRNARSVSQFVIESTERACVACGVDGGAGHDPLRRLRLLDRISGRLLSHR